MSDELAIVPKGLIKLLEEVSSAFEAVHDLGVPHQGESLSDLHQRLLTTRATMSRVSELVAQIIRLRGRVDQALIERKGELEDAEAAILTKATKNLAEDFSSAKERNAKLGAQTLEERRNVRFAERVLADVKSAQEYSTNRLWELDRSVRDIDTRLKILAYDPGVS